MSSALIAIITTFVSTALGIVSNIVANRIDPHIGTRKRALIISFSALVGALAFLSYVSSQEKRVVNEEGLNDSNEISSQNSFNRTNSDNLEIQNNSGSINITQTSEPITQENSKAEVEISQFYLNENISPYLSFCSLEIEGRVVNAYTFNIVGSTLLRHLANVIYEKEKKEAEITGEWPSNVQISPEELISLPSDIREKQQSWSSDEITEYNIALDKMPIEIRQELEGEKLNNPQETLSGLDPVFDVTFLNTGGRALVLTEMESLPPPFYIEGGGDVAAIGLPPLAVTKRYRIDLDDLRDLPTGTPVALSPPIKIPPGEALRIQIQFSWDSTGWYQIARYLSLRFNFGNAISVSPEDFILIGSGGPYSDECLNN